MSLLVVGSVAYDSVQTDRESHDDVLGGSATYFSIASSIFTTPSLVAVVGEDFRQEDVEVLRASGVDLSGLRRVDGRTFRWGGRYHDDMKGRDTLFTELNVFEQFEPVLTDEHRQADIVFLGNIHPGLQMSVLDQVESPSLVAADTMNLWIDIAKSELMQVLERVGALFINDEEATQLTGERTMARAARAIQSIGPRIVVIKRGEHGALMFDHDEAFYVPAHPLEDVIDPTGAGDSFAGGFLGYLARCRDRGPQARRRAAVVGSLVASYCVEGFSIDRLRKVDHDQVTDRYVSFMNLTRFQPLANLP